jgi:hypothetical protein
MTTKRLLNLLARVGAASALLAWTSLSQAACDVMSVTAGATTATSVVFSNVTDCYGIRGEAYTDAVFTSYTGSNSVYPSSSTATAYAPGSTYQMYVFYPETYGVVHPRVWRVSSGVGSWTMLQVGPPTALSATDGAFANKVTVSWGAPTYTMSSASVTEYQVRRNGALIATTTAATMTFDDTTVVPGVTYTYSVESRSFGYGNGAVSNTDTGSALDLSGLVMSATQDRTDGVLVSFNQSIPVAYYAINHNYRDLAECPCKPVGALMFSAPVCSSTGDASLPATGTFTSTLDTNYNVNDIQSCFSLYDKNTTQIVATAVGLRVGPNPIAPASISATDGTINNSVTINWGVGANATYYKVFSSPTAGGAKTEIASNINGTTYSNTTANATNLFYSVQSCSPTTCSTNSTEDAGYANVTPTSSSTTATTDAITSISATPTTIDLNPGNTFTYTILTQPTAGQGDCSIVSGKVQWTPPAGNGFSGTASCTYSAVDQGGLSVNGTATFTVNPYIVPVPSGITATDGTVNNSVTITWGPIAGATYYKVFTAPSSGGAKTEIASNVNGTTYSNATANATNLYYSVQACTATACSANSSEDSGFANVAPTSTSASATTDSMSPVQATANTIDPNTGDTFTYTILTQPTAGQGDCSIVSGKIQWTPPAGNGYSGNTSCAYTVTDQGGLSLNGLATFAVTAYIPAIPATVSATDGTINNSVTITWGAVAHAGHYKVFTSLSAGGAKTEIASSVPGLSFDNPSAGSAILYYSVQACLNATCGAYSSADSGFANVPPTSTSASAATDYSTAVLATPVTVDPNAGDTFTYSVISFPSTEGTCSIVSNKIQWAPLPGTAFAGNMNCVYRATDQHGLSVDGTAVFAVSCGDPVLYPVGLSQDGSKLVGTVWMPNCLDAASYPVTLSIQGQAGSQQTVSVTPFLSGQGSAYYRYEYALSSPLNGAYTVSTSSGGASRSDNIVIDRGNASGGFVKDNSPLTQGSSTNSLGRVGVALSSTVVPVNVPMLVDTPACTLSAYPSTALPNQSIVLTAHCNPSVTGYAWSEAACSPVSPVCVVSYPVPGSYAATVSGINSVGSGANTMAAITVNSAPVLAVPSCTLNASPSAVNAGGGLTLTATCTPQATAYAWSEPSCGAYSASCFVIYTTTGSHTPTVAGSNASGTGAQAMTSITVN